MAARIRTKHQDEVRSKIQTTQLINRLQDHVFGDVDISQTQLKAIEILLKKNLPDLSAVEVSAHADNPIQAKVTVELVRASTDPGGA